MNTKKDSFMYKCAFIFKVITFFYSDVIKIRPGYLLLVISQIICDIIFPLLNIYIIKSLIDNLIFNSDKGMAFAYIAIMILLSFIYGILKKILIESQNSIGDQFERYYDLLISQKAMDLNYVDIENTKILDLCKKAEDGMKMAGGIFGVPNGIQGITTNISNIISSFMVVIGTILVICKHSPLLIIIVIINVIGSIIFSGKIGKIEIKYFSKNIDTSRMHKYLCNDLMDIKYGKDIRIYNASEVILKKEEETENLLIEKERMRGKELRKTSKKNVLINSLSEGLIYLYLGIKAVAGIVTIGEFTALIQAATIFSSSMINGIYNSITLYKNCEFMNHYIIFSSSVDRKNGKNLKKVNFDVAKIEFKNVSFKYPNTNEYVLRNINLTITPGEHLSIVGLNGAGKTTLIKLFCRLYNVTSGEILLNDTNIDEYKNEEYVNLISVVFQDFKLFAFSIYDNITLEKNDSNYNDIMELCNKVGLKQLVDKVENGLGTSIYKAFDEQGIEPSGGEAQKIALARALYKDSPIVILDEPTASLDPLAEYETNERFERMVRSKTAIYISHRLSACKFCDRIAVLHDGSIVEYGAHNELMKNQNGLYHAMYTAQAQYYQ